MKLKQLLSGVSKLFDFKFDKNSLIEILIVFRLSRGLRNDATNGITIRRNK